LPLETWKSRNQIEHGSDYVDGKEPVETNKYSESSKIAEETSTEVFKKEVAEFIYKTFNLKQTTPKTGAVHISHSIENSMVKLTKRSLMTKRTTPKHVALAEHPLIKYFAHHREECD
jgi:hypothetical protein